MIIRNYLTSDEKEWIKCRLLAFFDTSYATDIRWEKEQYKEAIELVAEEDGQLVGFLDIELHSALQTNKNQAGGVIWHMGVLPEFRQRKIAQQLWYTARQLMLEQDIHYCELWTQEDPAANAFYRKQKFQLLPESTYLRCSLKPNTYSLPLTETFNPTYYVENYLFQAPLTDKQALLPICESIQEVRLYGQEF